MRPIHVIVSFSTRAPGADDHIALLRDRVARALAGFGLAPSDGPFTFSGESSVQAEEINDALVRIVPAAAAAHFAPEAALSWSIYEEIGGASAPVGTSPLLR